MNPYEKKRRWKIFLLVFAIIIGTASVFYSDFFVKKMEREEKVQFELWVKVQKNHRRSLTTFAIRMC
jgi:two-component system, sporulation sensor kinase D